MSIIATGATGSTFGAIDRAMTSVAIKQIFATSREKLVRHFQKLEPDDQRLRFGISQSPESIKSYVDHINFDRDALFGVYDDELELAGVAHVALDKDTAEFGVSVLTAHRGEGIGTALFERAHSFARNHYIHTLYVHCLTENKAMMHIARKAGMRIQTDSGESDAWLELPLMNAATLASEMFAEQVAVLDYTLKAHARTVRNISDALAGRDADRKD